MILILKNLKYKTYDFNQYKIILRWYHIFSKVSSFSGEIYNYSMINLIIKINLLNNKMLHLNTIY